MTKICCVCQRVENGDHWKNDYVFTATERVTHGYCPLCFDVVMSELTDYYIGEKNSTEENVKESGSGGLKKICEQKRSVCV